MKSDYYNTKESVDEYIEMAKDVNGGALIKKLRSYLPSGSSVLEIGAGPGTDWKILRKYYQVIGSDNSPEFLKRLIMNNPKERFLELSAITLETDFKFDGIYSNKVLHHLTDEELKLSVLKQAEILNPYGKICHSFWKGEGSEVFNGLFVNNHSENDLKLFFGEIFEILLLDTYAEFEDGDSILLIAKRNY